MHSNQRLPHRGYRRVPRYLAAMAVAALTIAGSAACSAGPNERSGATPVPEAGEGDTAWQEVVTAAQEEGEVVFYTVHAEAVMNTLAEAFEDEYGISVTIFRALDNDIQPKLAAEASTGARVADVIGVSDLRYLKEQSAEGAFAEPVGPAFENPELDLEKITIAPGVLTSVATVMSFAWNTELYPDGMKDFDGLLDPELAGGKIGLLDPVTVAAMDFYTHLENRFGDDILEELAAQKPRFYTSGAAMVEALTSGEVLAAAPVSQVPLFAAMDAGAPVDGALTAPVWAAPLSEAILADAPHPNAAQVFMNYMFSARGQEILGERVAAALPGTKSAVIDLGETSMGGADPAAFDAFRSEFNSTFSR